MVVDAQARFLAPGRFDEEIDVSYAIEQLGTTSMTAIARAAARRRARWSTGRMVYVFVDPATMAKREIAPDGAGAARALDHRIWRPVIARATTSRWISEVPSKIV